MKQYIDNFVYVSKGVTHPCYLNRCSFFMPPSSEHTEMFRKSHCRLCIIGVTPTMEKTVWNTFLFFQIMEELQLNCYPEVTDIRFLSKIKGIGEVSQFKGSFTQFDQIRKKLQKDCEVKIV